MEIKKRNPPIGPIRRDRRKTLALERIADSLERLVIAADSLATALSLQTLAKIQKREPTDTLDCFAPPINTAPQHLYVPVEGNQFCGKCGAGSFHPIHRPVVKPAGDPRE